MRDSRFEDAGTSVQHGQSVSLKLIEGRTSVRRGICKWFNSQKGYGFITPEDGSGDVFVHQSVIKADGFRSLAEGEPLEYYLDLNTPDKAKASYVTGPGGSNVRGAPQKLNLFKGNFRSPDLPTMYQGVGRNYDPYSAATGFQESMYTAAYTGGFTATNRVGLAPRSEYAQQQWPGNYGAPTGYHQFNSGYSGTPVSGISHLPPASSTFTNPGYTASAPPPPQYSHMTLQYDYSRASAGITQQQQQPQHLQQSFMNMPGMPDNILNPSSNKEVGGN